MDRMARNYVKLVLALGEHEPAYVDAYYGPPEWRAEVHAQKPTLPEIRARAHALAAEIRAVPGADPRRVRFLTSQLDALAVRAEMVEGKKLGFDQESRALYDAVAPPVSDERLRAAVRKVDVALGGTGPLTQRLEAFDGSFTVPRDRLDRVVQAAIAECRARTAQWVKLPAEEAFRIEYVKNKPWGGYNWYEGNYRSLIQINIDLPFTIDRALDVACHEGYPGHHVANVLFEQHGVKERGWIELTVSPLFSPLALMMEGTANYGVDLAFPDEERLRFEREVLFPLAGLDPKLLDRYTEIRKLKKELRYATNEASRRRIDGGADPAATARFLVELGATTPARAEKLVSFIDFNRAYVINYNLGEDLVGAYVAKTGGESREARWNAFLDLLIWPRPASAL
jgi:hypothetical protein